MPKRSAEEKIERYNKKIRKLQDETKRKKKKKSRRIISSDDDEIDTGHQEEIPISSQNQDFYEIEEVLQPENVELNENEHVLQTENILSTEEKPTENKPAEQILPSEPDLDPELLLALGDAVSDTPEFGVKILDSQAKLWLPILKKGLPKEPKENLLKEYIVPDNCRLLQAPKLNAEIAAALPDMVRNRDKSTLVVQQQQLGAGITAVNRAMDLLLLNGDRLQAIKHLSNGCRLLSDLHFTFTQCRTKLITPSLDKTCLNVIHDAERDSTLFGEKLSENIKAAKIIERQGLQIKKALPQKATTSHTQTGARPTYQGNWQPPRYLSNRGGRGGNRRPAPAPPAPRRTLPPTSTKNVQQNKPRAPAHQ